MVRIGLLPFFKLCAAMVLGILLQRAFPNVYLTAFWLVSIAAVSAMAILLLSKWVPKPSQNYVKGLLLFVAFVALAFLNARYAQSQRNAAHFSKITEAEIVLVEITEAPIQKEKSTKCLAQVRAVYHEKWQYANGQILLYLRDTQYTENIIGKQLYINREKIGEIDGPKNPNQFDYAAFLAAKGIFHQAFLTTSDYVFSPKAPRNSFLRMMAIFRQRLIENLAYLPENTKAVAEALLLGYKENINNETRNAFSKTGTMHILAVSGLHVGIIYWVLEKVLFFIFGLKNGRARFFKTISLLLGLWSYAFLTGMPPSVMRAALMFSVVAIGNNILRPNNIYNNVLLSAFILLLFSPQLLFDLSFQLSYAAVFGIITFQPIFSQWMYVKNKVLKFFWNLTTVSLAAQISTFPITLYYFNQMPIIFLISNLIAIPGAFAVVALGGFLQLCSLCGGLFYYYVKVLYGWVLFILVESIDFLSKLPFANIEKVTIANWDLALLYALILALSLAYFQKNKKWIYVAASLFFIEQSAYLFYQIKNLNHKEFVVFSQIGESLYGCKTQEQSLIASLNAPLKSYEFATQGWLATAKNTTEIDFEVDSFYQKNNVKKSKTYFSEV